MQLQEESNFSIVGNIIVIVLLCLVGVLIILLIRKIVTTILDAIEMFYARFTKRPIFVHFYLILRDLNANGRTILENENNFYVKLNKTKKRFFRHRVARFIKKVNFEGKEGFEITEEAKVRVAATAIMLTFGFRKYLLEYLQHIIIYPSIYYSRFSKSENKGEFNARIKTIVLSWDNFLMGNTIVNDRLNLGIHEVSHAIHFNSIKSEDISSILFVDTFNRLRELLSSDEVLKQKLTKSGLIRSYAFTNDSELLAVVIETFIETPAVFRRQFPRIYHMVKQMLNFNFEGY